MALCALHQRFSVGGHRQGQHDHVAAAAETRDIAHGADATDRLPHAVEVGDGPRRLLLESGAVAGRTEHRQRFGAVQPEVLAAAFEREVARAREKAGKSTRENARPREYASTTRTPLTEIRDARVRVTRHHSVERVLGQSLHEIEGFAVVRATREIARVVEALALRAEVGGGEHYFRPGRAERTGLFCDERSGGSHAEPGEERGHDDLGVEAVNAPMTPIFTPATSTSALGEDRESSALRRR